MVQVQIWLKRSFVIELTQAKKSAVTTYKYSRFTFAGHQQWTLGTEAISGAGPRHPLSTPSLIFTSIFSSLSISWLVLAKASKPRVYDPPVN